MKKRLFSPVFIFIRLLLFSKQKQINSTAMHKRNVIMRPVVVRPDCQPSGGLPAVNIYCVETLKNARVSYLF